MDTIADMLTRLRNAQLREKDFIEIPFSKINFSVIRLLVKEGYLKKAFRKEKDGVKYIRVALFYEKKDTGIKNIKRISRPGRRIYRGYKEITQVLNGLGVAILSTSEGIMTNKEARRKKIGGEVICEVY